MEPIEIKITRRKSKDDMEVIDLPLPFRKLRTAVTATNATYNQFNRMVQEKCSPDNVEIKVFVGDRVIGPRSSLERAVFKDIYDKVPEECRDWAIQPWME